MRHCITTVLTCSESTGELMMRHLGAIATGVDCELSLTGQEGMRWWSLRCDVPNTPPQGAQAATETQTAVVACAADGRGPEVVVVSNRVAAGLFAQVQQPFSKPSLLSRLPPGAVPGYRLVLTRPVRLLHSGGTPPAALRGSSPY
jgi:hypothetical protein